MTEQLIAAAQQALEALESFQSFVVDAHILEGKWYWLDGTIKAITDLRTAIEAAEKQQALDKKAENARELGLDYEPASAYDQGWKDGYKHGAWANTAAPVQEPVQPANKCAFQIELKASLIGGSPYPAWVNTSEMERLASQLKKVGDRITLYTTPPAAQRQWVGLTDEDKLAIRKMPWEFIGDLIVNTEAKLREKNGGAV